MTDTQDTQPAANSTQTPPQTPPSEQLPVKSQWYVIHTQTGQEVKVKQTLEGRVRSSEVGKAVAQILVPVERVAEIRGGKKRISERKFFPGYILVQMEMNEESWHLVRTTAGVTGFIGAGRNPVALSDDEVNEIMRQAEERKEKPAPRVTFGKGEGVRVTEGPFNNFTGTIEEVNTQRGKLKVTVSIFGRQTPVELEFWQVERL